MRHADDVAATMRDIWCAALGIDRVEPGDNFFALGGESMAAAAIVGQIRDRLHAAVSLKDFYATPTFADAVARAARAGRLGVPQRPGTEPLDRRGPLRASLAQEWQFLMAEHPSQDGIAPFLVQQAAHLRGPLDTGRLRRALDLVSQRHELLRAAFRRDGDHVHLIVDPGARVELVEVPVTGTGRGLIRAEADRGFDRRAAPLARCSLFSFSATDHVAVFAMDHIICDGISVGIFLRDVEAAYQGLGDDPVFTLPPVALGFADWAHAQRRHGTGERLAAVRDYWRERLGDDPAIIGTPFTAYRPTAIERSAGVEIALGAEETAAVRAGAVRRGVTVYALILGGFLTALRERVSRTDFCVVTTLANREPGTEDVFGPLAHDAYVRVDLAAATGLDALAAQAQDSTSEAATHGVLPNMSICELLWPHAGLEVLDAPAFYFSMNPSWAAGFRLPGTRVDDLRTTPTMPMPGLECTVVDTGARITMSLRYLAGSFPTGYVDALGGDVLRTLLDAERPG